MKAIYYDRYGTPDVLELREVDMPKPGPDQVLVKVHAASINSWDWDMVRGSPWIVRIWGLTGPRQKIPGADIAGVVVEVGPRVTKFKVGDEVLGDLCESGWGGYAEYACAGEMALSHKPKDISFLDAAAIPQAGLMALQSIIKGRLARGMKLLMNGAGGGVGTFAIQIARSIGAEVTVVDRADKLLALRELGAHHAIDYQKEDFTKNGVSYDLIIDVVASRSMFDYRRALAPTGSLVLIGGTMSVLFGSLIIRSMMSSESGKKYGILAYRVNERMDEMLTLIRQGKVRPVIDSVYPLERTRDAFRHFAESNFRGKVMIEVG